MSRLVDDDALQSLLAAVGRDEGALSRFVRDFVSMWATRLERLTAALARPDAEDAHVVLLSIRSSSRMVGAQMVEATASLMHSSLDRGDLAGCATHLGRLSQVGDETTAELQQRFGLISHA